MTLSSLLIFPKSDLTQCDPDILQMLNLYNLSTCSSFTAGVSVILIKLFCISLTDFVK